MRESKYKDSTRSLYAACVPCRAQVLNGVRARKELNGELLGCRELMGGEVKHALREPQRELRVRGEHCTVPRFLCWWYAQDAYSCRAPRVYIAVFAACVCEGVLRLSMRVFISIMLALAL
jgi:hypothetical protein